MPMRPAGSTVRGSTRRAGAAASDHSGGGTGGSLARDAPSGTWPPIHRRRQERPGSFREHDIEPSRRECDRPNGPRYRSSFGTGSPTPSPCVKSRAPPPGGLAGLHSRFEQVHPFLDGNGRAGRRLNLLLIRLGYPPAIIYKGNRRHLAALRRADQGDLARLGSFWRGRSSTISTNSSSLLAGPPGCAAPGAGHREALGEALRSPLRGAGSRRPRPPTTWRSSAVWSGVRSEPLRGNRAVERAECASSAILNRLRRRVPEGPHCQPRRDRDPRRPHAEGDGHHLGRRLLGDRPRRAARARGRRGLPDRPRGPGRELPEHREDHRDRQGGRRRRDPPRLRLPRRERRDGARLRRGRDHLDRPAAGGDRSDGLEDERRARSWSRPGCRSSPARPRSRKDLDDGPQAGRRSRLPGRLQGGGRRWRQGLPGGDDARRPRRRPSRARPAKARSSSPTTASTSSATSRTRATSRSRCWPTRTAT